MPKFIQWFLAYFRLNQKAVCAMSNTNVDYHDYPDATDPYPMHFHTYICRHCKAEFTI